MKLIYRLECRLNINAMIIKMKALIRDIFSISFIGYHPYSYYSGDNSHSCILYKKNVKSIYKLKEFEGVLSSGCPLQL